MGKLPRLDFGIDLVEGLPGAGKSFYAVKRMLQIVEEQRRPVYTNLPLKWKLIRHYLKLRCGDRVAGLVRELRKPHFDRFMQRSVHRAAYHDERRDIRLHPTVLYQRVDAKYVEEHGPDIIEDGALSDPRTRKPLPANWLPQAALIIIDEAHKWYPMRGQKSEDAALLDYLSMHRHMMHWIWFLTQDKTNISISVRKLYQTVVQVRNLKEDKLFYGLRMKHLGIRGMGYRGFTKDQVEGKAVGEEYTRPILDELVFPWLPHNQVFFRLYSSFSQMASLREIEKALASARVSCGLDEIGRQADVHVPESTTEESASWLQRLWAAV